MIFLIVFTVSQLYVYNIDQFDNYTQAAEAAINTSSNKASERISISNVQLDTSGLVSPDALATVTIANTGGVTFHVVAVWVDNLGLSTAAHTRIPEDVFVSPGLSATLTSLDTKISAASRSSMTIRVVTALGNSVSVQLAGPGVAGTTASTLATTQMTLIPNNPITTNQMTITLTVTNNNLQGVSFSSLQPDLCVAAPIQTGTVWSVTPPVISGASLAAGTASAGGGNTLTDSTKAWVTNQWMGTTVQITSGPGSPGTATITSNNANTLTVVSWSGGSPGLGSVYAILPLTSGATSPFSSTTLADSSRTSSLAWSANEWTGYVVSITGGTGAGQSRRIASNTAGALTLLATTPWTTTPGPDSSYTIASPGCDSLYSTLTAGMQGLSNQVRTDYYGTATAAGTTSLTAETSKPWTTNEWQNYQVYITSGTGAGEVATIASNSASPANVLTVPAWPSGTPASTATYVIIPPGPVTPPCNPASVPVTCTYVSGPNPSSVSFLAFGGTAVIQWIYVITTTVPDLPISIASSYVKLNTTGLVTSPATQNQAPTSTATVRSPGGASSSAGQNIPTILGSLVLSYTSFQYAKVGTGGQPPVCWKAGYQPKGSDTTVFRVSVTNVGSTTIMLTQDSEYVSLKAATGGGGQLSPTEWFIAQNAQASGGVIAPVAYSGGPPVTIAPGQATYVYFGSTTQNSATAPALPASGARLFTFIILFGTQTGLITNFGESIPFVGLTTTSSDPAGCQPP